MSISYKMALNLLYVDGKGCKLGFHAPRCLWKGLRKKG